ncbi:MAG: autotransporter outer membrane beta-barrel domain-containing protein [Fervidicoccaceae archaeon]
MINVEATGIGGNATGYYADAYAVGDAEAYGVYAYDIGNFSNSGTINVEATGIGGNANATEYSANAGGYAYAYGVYAYDIGNFTNKGTINVTAIATNGNAEAFGVEITSVGNFTNKGTINVFVTGSSVEAYGVSIENLMGNLVNNGNILVSATSNGTASSIEGIDVGVSDNGSIENNGQITISTRAINSLDYIYGIYAYFDSDGSLVNNGNISVSATSEDGYSEYVYGIYYYGNANINFFNSGNIKVSVVSSNSTGSGNYYIDEVYGVEGLSSGGSFVNTGNIEVSADARNGGYELYDVYGVYLDGIDSFLNNGTIKVTALLGDNPGYVNDSIDLYNVYGVYLDSSISDFINNGNILVNATAGTGYGGDYYYSDVYVCYIYGVYLEGNANNFTNNGTIFVDAQAGDSEGYWTWVVGIDDIYGIYINGYVGSFTNTGNVTVIAKVGDSNGFHDGEVYIYDIYGVYVNEEVNSFTNEGNIVLDTKVDNANGKTTYAYITDISGVYIDGASDSFTNKGNIVVSATLGNATGEDSSVYSYSISGVEIWSKVGNFTNEGNIRVQVSAGDASGVNSSVSNYYVLYNAGTYGVYIGNNVDVINFENKGNITATVQTGSAKGDGSSILTGWVVGVDIGSDDNYGQYVDNFVNKGNIIVSAKAKDAEGTDSTINVLGVSPVWIDYSTVNNFENKGLLYGLIEAGSAIGNNSSIFLGYASTNGFLGDVYNFSNFGTIFSGAKAGSAVGENSTIEIRDIAGVYFGGYVDSFNNTGLISVSVDAGSATGNNSTVSINYVSPLIFDEGIGTVTNSGNLITNVKAGANAEISDVAGLVISGSGGTIVNSGNIYVNIDSPDAKTVDRVAGIFVIDSNDIYLSNLGAIYLSTNKPNSNIRTLWLENSNATLRDKFAITFGMPGIDPEMRPIYVGSGSELTLNATLIARGDSRNLKLGIPYYLIENNGTVEGEWLGLERGYANPAISVSWYDPTQLGENSSVIFNYIPTATSEAEESSIAPIMGALGTDYIIIPDLINMISFTSPSSPTGIFTRFMKEGVMYASVGASDAGTSGLSSLNMERGWIWFTPYYIRVNADDLGFDVDSYGFTMGIGGRISERLAGDIFVSYFNNDVDFSVMGADKDDIDYFAGGFNLVYKVTPWYVRMTGLGYTAEHDYKGYTGLNFDLKEKADYRSYGGVLEVLGGVIKGNKVKVIPEIGLRYGYYKTKDFWTEVSANPGLNRKYEPDELNVFHLIGGLMILGEYKKGDENEIRVFGRIRLEQAISDNDISTITYAPNQPKYQLERGIADTNCVVQGGMNWNYKKRWNFELSGIADLNADYSAYGGRFLIRYNF